MRACIKTRSRCSGGVWNGQDWRGSPQRRKERKENLTTEDTESTEIAPRDLSGHLAVSTIDKCRAQRIVRYSTDQDRSHPTGDPNVLDRNVAKSFSVLLVSLFSFASVAQTPKPEPPQAIATNSSSARVQPSDGIAHITLGQSVLPLNGPWKFTIGDSPIDPATHQPLWSEPAFDDSHWETVDLTPPARLLRSQSRHLRLCPRLDGQRPSRLLRLRLVPHPGQGQHAARREALPCRPHRHRRRLPGLRQRHPAGQLRRLLQHPSRHLQHPANPLPHSTLRARHRSRRYPGNRLPPLDGPVHATI